MIPEAIAERIRQLVAEYLSGPDKAELHPVVQTTGALPVYRDMGGTLFLPPDGVILAQAHNDQGPPALEQDPGWRLAALVSAVEDHPELAALVPDRPRTASDCQECKGTGRIRVSGVEFAFFCGECRGIGWLRAVG
jgi:hypothetical protein